MTERKPPRMTFESWTERQIRTAVERGEFDGLPGAGQPLPGLSERYHEDWWLRQLAQREQIALLPPALALRRRAELLQERLPELPSEAAVRRQVSEFNHDVREAIRVPRDGPPVVTRTMDVEDAVRQWRMARGRATAERVAEAAPPPGRTITDRGRRDRLPWGRRQHRETGQG